MTPKFLKSPLVFVSAFGLVVSGCIAYASTDAPSGDESRSVEQRVDESPRLASRRVPSPDSDSATVTTSETVSVEEALASRSRGASWLKSVQKADGGWGAGAWGTDDPKAPSDVATTSLIILALHRDAAGRDIHDASVRKAIRYVASVVETSPAGARLKVPDATQPQYKLGKLVDTHFAALMFGEVIGTQDDSTETVMASAHKNVIKRVQLAQREDGSFDGDGWAPVLSSSVAASSLYRAQELGLEGDEEVFAKNEGYQRSKVKATGGSGGVVLDSTEAAGVDLYSAATTLKGNREAQGRASAPAAEKRASKGAEDAAYERISGEGSAALFSGFGSVGGEEMLSYMMISDTLADDGGEKFEEWNNKVSGYLAGIQNNDGSWAGHHCITSRTFVTAAAMMSLGAADAANMRAQRATKTGDDSGKRASTQGAFGPDVGTVE